MIDILSSFPDTTSISWNYVASLSFGTPSKSASCLFDTGSFITWIDAATYVTSKSSSYINPHQQATPMTYLDGTSIQGNLANDTVSISAKDNITNFQFVSASAGTLLGSNMLHCLVGMAPSTGGYQGDSFPLRLMSSGEMTSNVVSYYIDSTSVYGELIFGGVDTTKYSGTISWLPKYPSNTKYWSSWVGPITVPSQPSVQIYVNTSINVIFDTGTTLALFPLKTAASINQFLGANSQQTVGGTTYYSFPSCGNVHEWQVPNISMSLGGQIITLSYQQYLYQSGGACYTIFNGQDINFMLLGNVFLQNFYFIFDYDKGQVGIAASTGLAVGNGNLSSITTPTVTTTSPQHQSSAISAAHPSSSFYLVSVLLISLWLVVV